MIVYKHFHRRVSIVRNVPVRFAAFLFPLHLPVNGALLMKTRRQECEPRACISGAVVYSVEWPRAGWLVRLGTRV